MATAKIPIVRICEKGKVLLNKLKILEGSRLQNIIILAALTLYAKKHFPGLIEEIAVEEQGINQKAA